MKDEIFKKLDELEITASYVAFGREFQTLDINTLTSYYLIAAEALLAAPTLQTIRQLENLSAEFELRDASPPIWVFAGRQLDVPALRKQLTEQSLREPQPSLREKRKD